MYALLLLFLSFSIWRWIIGMYFVESSHPCGSVCAETVAWAPALAVNVSRETAQLRAVAAAI